VTFPTLALRPARMEEHPHLVQIARQSRYTRDFANRIFSGPDCYESGRIRVLTQEGKIRGFTCFRRRIRDGILVLYFIGVEQAGRSRGLGRLLMVDLMGQAGPAGIELKVAKANEGARRFYSSLGYVEVAEAFGGEGVALRAQRKTPEG
jgi:ribosomal protein S18 acetylase RimI-like enzyme